MKSALIKFFDGPTEDEARDTPAFKPFECDFGDSILVGCSASDVFKSVRIENGVAYIELLGVPVAATSAYVMGFLVPLSLTVSQFSNVDDFKFVVKGVEFEPYFPEGCPRLCFTFGWTVEDLKNIGSAQ